MHKLKTMKPKNLLILFSIVATIFMGCEKDRLDTPPRGNTEESFFKDVSEFRQNLVSVYGKLYDYYFFNPEWGFATCVSSLWLLPGDDLSETQGARAAEELFDGTMNPSNQRIRWTFDKSYELIARANVTIDKVRTVDFSQFPGADEIAMMEGEALFLRGYAYFMLFNIYGNVPLVTERILTEDKTNTPVSDKLDVLNQVIADAEEAIQTLPESWSADFRGRATKNSARGLLAKALVFRGNYTGNTADYTEALTVFNSITATLTTDFTDNFSAFQENNEESLFEIQASKPTGGDNVFLYNDGGWRGVECMTVYRGSQTVNGTDAANWARTKFVITEKLLANFGTDPRITVFLDTADGYAGKLFQKYTKAGLDSLVPDHYNSVNNERVLRYADLKLLAAEAMLKTGNSAGAIDEINDIRARGRDWGLASGFGDGSIPADRPASETNIPTIMQWIMDERFVEQAGEGQRWWDLKRWNASGDVDLTGWDGSVNNFSTNLASEVQFDISKHLLFPLPQEEVDRNSAILENNPGY